MGAIVFIQNRKGSYDDDVNVSNKKHIYPSISYNMSRLNTHRGSLEIIPADMEVRPSLTVTTGAPVFFSEPTTNSSTISPIKKGVACRHTHKESWFSTVTKCQNISVSSPLLLLAVVLSLNICLGRWAKSLQHFHVLWSMMFVSLCEAGATGLKPQCTGRPEVNICLSRAALEVEMTSLAELNISANKPHIFIFSKTK